MDLSFVFLMRNELLLTALVLLVLLAEIFVSDGSKQKIITWAAVVFAVVCFIGFLPMPAGELFGGSFRTDAMTVLMKNILNIGTLIIFLQSFDWLKKPENNEKTSEYYLLTVATLMGMNFMISSGDFLMMYIGIELATIPMATLAAFERYSSKSAEAGIKLILTSALSTGIMLFGISFLYGSTGSIYFTDMAPQMSGSSIQTLGFIFFTAGMAFKISLVPFHLWTADVYEGAPVNVTSYLSVVSKGAASFTFMIILYKVFAQMATVWQPLLYTLAVATMTIGNLFAMRQNNFKRFLAFSSIAQAGFILLGIMQAGTMGSSAVVYFMLIYVFTNLAAFGVVSAVSTAAGKENISDYKGFYQTNPKLTLTFLLALFSLAGIPPAAGFFGKFFLFQSAASAGYYILVFIAVLNATISLYYYLKPILAMFIGKNETPIEYFRSSLPMRLSLGICIAGIFMVGFMSFIYEYIHSISFGL